MKCRINACYCLPSPPSRPKLDEQGFWRDDPSFVAMHCKYLAVQYGNCKGFVTWWGPSLLLAWVTHSDCFLTLLCSWSTSLLVLGNPDACLCYTVEIFGGGSGGGSLWACQHVDSRILGELAILLCCTNIFLPLFPPPPRLIDQYKYKPGLSIRLVTLGHFSVSRSNCKIHLQGLP